jgi:hypothetical protein
MRLIIEIFERPVGDGQWSGDSGYVAVATRDGALTATGGPGSGGSVRAAAQEALNSLFKREEEIDRASKPEPLLDAKAPADDFGLSDDIFSAQNPEFAPAVSTRLRGDFGSGSFVGYFSIMEALNRYIENKATGERPTIKIDYEDSSGRKTYGREIIPTSLDPGQNAGRPFASHSAKLTAIDVDKDEPRHFIVDRIERLVIA